MTIELTKLMEIATNAGEAIMKIYGNMTLFDVKLKDDQSPLTQADRDANQIIVDGLAQLKVVYPVLSEESKAIPFEIRKNYEYFWMVDPLDGTKEFIKRNGEFTVNIALIHKGCPVFGIVYVPASRELFYAQKNCGAFKIQDGIERKLKAVSFNKAQPGLRVVASRSHLSVETKNYVEQLNEPNLISKGSSLKFLIIATGDAELYPRMAPTMEWDTAAAQIILEEAGGSVIKYEDGKPLEYNKENLMNPYFLASANQL